MELVAVEAHVQDVERAHGRPAILVGEGERDQAVGLDLLGQLHELVPGLRDCVTLLREQALPIEHDPRVGNDRHGVFLAVITLGGLGHALRVVGADRLPDVVDRSQQAVAGREPETLTGEPLHDVLGRALHERVELILEIVVIRDGDGGGDARLGRAVIDHRLDRRGRDLLVLIRADRRCAERGRGGRGGGSGCGRRRRGGGSGAARGR